MNFHFNIYITIISTFGIILIGYFFGRCNVITAAQGKGISLYLVKLALPVLIFKALVSVDFSRVNWLLWTGILAGKAIVFFVVVILTMTFQKENRLSTAGLYGIFATQSNDFAFGLPIVESIFNTPKCQYLVNYVYLVAPINLAFLNPISFSLMEYEKAKNSITNTEDSSRLEQDYSSGDDDLTRSSHRNILKKTLLTTFKGILTNPLVFMIVFGVVFNFIFQRKIPQLLSLFFDNISDSFGATALFYLGWSLGTKATIPKGLNFVLPVILVLTKGILLPLLMRLTVSWMVDEMHHNHRNTTSNATQSLEDQATFAFIYGSIPTAPTVAVFASMYNLAEDVVASGLVLGTVLFAPVLFASVQMMRVLNMKNIADFCKFANVVTKDVSILNVICCLWVIVVFATLRLHKRVPHVYTLVFVLVQLTVGMHGLLYVLYESISDPIAKRLVYWLLMVTMYGYCTWSVVLSVVVGFLGSDSYPKMVPFMIAFGMGTPILIATVMISAHPDISQSCSPYFMLPCQVKDMGLRGIFIALNMLAFLSIVGCLIKVKKNTVFHDMLLSTGGIDSERTQLLGEPSESTQDASTTQGKGVIQNYYSIRETSLSRSNSNTSLSRTIRAKERTQLATGGYASTFHCGNHLILILTIGFVALVNTAAGLWYYVSEEDSGLLLALQMLGLILTYGQGFFTFITFGFLKELFLLPFFEQCYTCFKYSRRMAKVSLPDISDLDFDVINVCSRFRETHLRACNNDIVKELIISTEVIVKVFTGTQLVDWLVSTGVCWDRSDAVAYGNKLLLGRLVHHVNDEHLFYDLPYFYSFLNYEDDKISH